MRRMEPAILRFDLDAPDSAELRYYLRHAGSLLAASEVESPQRALLLTRARAWVVAALSGIDWNLRAIGSTETHAATDELVVPTLARVRRPE
jgi:hypothetical protein